MSILRKVSGSINNIYTKALSFGGLMLHRHTTKKLLRRHPSASIELYKDEEKLYERKWSRLRKNPDKNCFRLFSQYIGPNPDIVPEDISAGIVQPLLNPIEYRPYYCDKNMFEKIFPADYLPTTIFRRIRGIYYDKAYSTVNVSDKWLNSLNIQSSKIFIKPSVDSSSGHGVVCFKKKGEEYISPEGVRFDMSFLNEYSSSHDDFIVQEGLSQSEYISQFNPTSVNTIRVATYKSVKDNKVHVCGIIMRMGKTGAYVDNAHAGGLLIGVDKTGKLTKYACDQYGDRYEEFNGLNFQNSDFQIPSFDRIVKFAESVGEKIIHHRLIAQDIAIQADGTPCLVEFNIRAFSTWLFQFTSGAAYGDYADEIIEYCEANKHKITKVLVEPF